MCEFEGYNGIFGEYVTIEELKAWLIEVKK